MFDDKSIKKSFEETKKDRIPVPSDKQLKVFIKYMNTDNPQFAYVEFFENFINILHKNGLIPKKLPVPTKANFPDGINWKEPAYAAGGQAYSRIKQLLEWD